MPASTAQSSQHRVAGGGAKMRRHAERDDVILLAMELEFGRVVALVAVEDQ